MGDTMPFKNMVPDHKTSVITEQSNDNSQEKKETNPTEGVTLKLVVNGKEEEMTLTMEELATKVQLSEASTRKFQEASELRKQALAELEEAKRLKEEVASNKQTADPTPIKKVNGDYPDEVYAEIKRLKDMNQKLLNDFNSVSESIRTRKTEETINTLMTQYGVNKEFIDKTVLPYMSKKGIDDIEVGIKACMFDSNMSVKTGITPDRGIGKKLNADPNISKELGNQIINASGESVFSKLKKLK